MTPAVFLIALLSTVGMAAFTVIKVARYFANRPPSLSNDMLGRVQDLERGLQNLQQELAETQERLDFTERLLSSARKERLIGG